MLRLFPLLLLLLLGCGKIDRNETMLQLAQRFEQKADQRFPWFDPDTNDWPATLPIRSEKKRIADLVFLKTYQDSMEAISTDQLIDSVRLIRQGMALSIKALRNKIVKEKFSLTDPRQFNIAKFVRPVLAQAHRPLVYRIEIIDRYFKQCGVYYRNARHELEFADIPQLTEAVSDHRTTYHLLDGLAEDSLKVLNLTEDIRVEWTHSIREAQRAVKDYIAFCNSLSFELKNSGLIKRSPNAVEGAQPEE